MSGDRKACWGRAALVEETEVDVEVDVGKVVLGAELQPWDLHGRLQKTARWRSI